MSEANLEIWNFAGTTPEEELKQIPGQRRLKSINAYYLIERATELWGPMGSGWGYSAEIKGMQDPRFLFCTLDLWYRRDDIESQGDPCVISEPVRVFDMISLKGRYQDGTEYDDEDAPKKLLTSCISKALSYLGFGHDVFRGEHDSKYPSSSVGDDPAPSRPTSSQSTARKPEEDGGKVPLPPSSSDGAEPFTPEGEFKNWLDDNVSNPEGKGKMRHYTWRQMCEGSYGGDRFRWLEWASKDGRGPMRERAGRCLRYMIWKQQQVEEQMDSEQGADLSQSLDDAGFEDGGPPF